MANRKKVRPTIDDLRRFRELGIALGVPPDLGEKPDERLLTTLARSGLTIDAAAGLLGVAPPTLKSSLGAIQKCLRRGTGPGTKLFQSAGRGGKKTLSAEGLACFRQVIELLGRHEQLGRFEKTSVEPVVIGAYGALVAPYLPAAVSSHLHSAEERSRHPLRFPEYTFPAIADAVHNRDVDFGVASVPSDAERTLLRGRVETESFGFQIPRVFLCGKDHPLARARYVRSDSLEGQVLVRLPSGASTPGLSEWRPTSALGKSEILEARSIEAIVQFVRVGPAVSVVPYLPVVEAAVRSGDVCCRSFPGLKPATVAGVLPSTGVRGLSSAAGKIYSMVRDYFESLSPLEVPDRD